MKYQHLAKINQKINVKIMFLKKVQATFCRSVKFKTSHKFILRFAFNRSTKGALNLFQKHDLHQTFFRKLSKNVENHPGPNFSYVKKYADSESDIRFG